MNILVTGGTGFLGSHLCKHLVVSGHAVKIMGRDLQKVEQLLDRGAEPVKADLRNEEKVILACQGCDVVIHAGALSSPWGHPKDFEDVNVGGTRAVLKGCEHYRVKRLIHISTPAVIFDGRDQINALDNAPYAKRHLSHYSYSKQKAEELVLAQEQKLERVILRPKAMYGPGDKALLPRLVNIAKAGRLPRIGNGQNYVALTYVSDVVDAIMCALDKPVNQSFPVYTLTGPETPLLWEVIKELLESLDIAVKLRPLPEWVALRAATILEFLGEITNREPSLTRYTVALLARHQTYDISRARRDLGYEPKVTITEGLRKTLEEVA